MICEYCQGIGGVQSEKGETIPCPECYGFRITHCCDGLCEQPEEDE